MASTPAALRQELDLLEGDLGERIAALGLERNVADLALNGYTIVRDVAPLEFFDRMRAAIVELYEDQRAEKARKGEPLDHMDTTWLLLGRGRVFEEALCNPKLVALNEFMLGKGFQIYTLGGSVKRAGQPPLALHNDYTAIRAPYPIHCQVFTSLWCCDDWTVEGGATRIVPGSFKWRRAPSPQDAQIETVPIECPKGSIIAWDGASWHCGPTRVGPGTRVGLHSPHSRMAVRPIDSNAHLSDDIVNRNPAVFRRLIGRDDFFGKTTVFGPDMQGLARMRDWIDT
jgi:hypothetical protein